MTLADSESGTNISWIADCLWESWRWCRQSGRKRHVSVAGLWIWGGCGAGFCTSATCDTVWVEDENEELFALKNIWGRLVKSRIVFGLVVWFTFQDVRWVLRFRNNADQIKKWVNKQSGTMCWQTSSVNGCKSFNRIHNNWDNEK